MRKVASRFMAAVIIAVGLSVVNAAEHNDPEVETAIAEAMRTLDEFMLRFNQRDPKAWASTLNYPHVRFASGTVRVWETEEEFATHMDFEAFAKRFGWDHSHWLNRAVVAASKDKVHFQTTFQRFNKKNEPIAAYKSLYIVTKVNGRWGIQARSSFAP